MLTPGLLPQRAGAHDERQLLRLYRRLDAESRRTLLRFAEFLAERSGSAPMARGDAANAATDGALAEPTFEARPAGESVVAAIKRLRRGYPMLDSGTMLQETSTLMAQHVLQGRDAAAVIDDLEALFAARYAALKDAAP